MSRILNKQGLGLEKNSMKVCSEKKIERKFCDLSTLFFRQVTINMPLSKYKYNYNFNSITLFSKLVQVVGIKSKLAKYIPCIGL